MSGEKIIICKKDVIAVTKLLPFKGETENALIRGQIFLDEEVESEEEL